MAAAEPTPAAESSQTEVKKTEKKEQKAKQAKDTATAKAATEASAAAESSVKRSRQVLVFGVPVDMNKKQFRAIATKAFRKTDVDLLKEVCVLMQRAWTHLL